MEQIQNSDTAACAPWLALAEGCEGILSSRESKRLGAYLRPLACARRRAPHARTGDSQRAGGQGQQQVALRSPQLLSRHPRIPARSSELGRGGCGGSALHVEQCIDLVGRVEKDATNVGVAALGPRDELMNPPVRRGER